MSPTAPTPPPPAPEVKAPRKWYQKKRWWAGIAFAVIVIAAASSSGKSSNNNSTASTVSPTDSPTVTTPTVATTTTAPAPVPTGPQLTSSEQNAVASAQQYLDLGAGFSRLGLIDQLSSSAGSGYPLHDATAAVDSMHIDWNAQAVLSAKSYRNLQAFSCSGMIQQLDSSAGGKFTFAQARYGAKAVGAC